MDSSTKKQWEHEFGSSDVGYDFTGGEMRKGAYGQTGSRYGWNFDEILPQSMGGGRNIENRQITRIPTNTARGNRMVFWLDGVMINGAPHQVKYQVKQTALLTAEEKKRVVNYCNYYKGKAYCILLEQVREAGFKSSVVETSPENAKYTISNILHDGADWVVIVSEKTPCTDRVIIDATFPQDDIKKSLDDGFRIGNIAYGGGQWAVVMKKGADWTGGQTYYRRDHWPSEEITELWKDYYISEFVCANAGDDKTLVVGSQFKSYTGGQTFKTGLQWPVKGVQKLRNKGYAITRIFCANGFTNNPCGVVLTERQSAEQDIWISKEWPGKERNNGTPGNFRILWDKGYRITELVYLNGHYLVVGSKNWGIGYQCFRYDKKFPLEAVRKLWNGDIK
jgi:hypothetical protein